MSIRIDKSKCVGCGRCAGVCPGSLIAMNAEGKAEMRYPKDCWGCASCVKECKKCAIALYLGADMGGMGSEMTVSAQGQFLDWTVTKADGTTETIRMDSKESNKY